MSKYLSIGVLLVGLLSATDALHAQRVFQDYQPTEGLLRIGPEPNRVIPMVDRGYTLVLPNDRPRGMIVLLDGWPTEWGPDDPGAGSLDATALEQRVGLLHLTTGNRLDFFFEDQTMANVALRIEGLLESHDLRDVPVFFAGLSLGGTRALKLAVFLAEHSQSWWLRPRAVAVADAPLDMIRFWHAEQRAIELDFHPGAADEGRWVSYLLETNLGGPPDAVPEAYRAYSPYTYGATLGGNSRHLSNLPISAYHEPDVDWWMEHRRKSYYEMNSLDLAAFIVELRTQGNEQAELLTTHQERQGYQEGSSPHTWSIVDNAQLISWFLSFAG